MAFQRDPSLQVRSADELDHGLIGGSGLTVLLEVLLAGSHQFDSCELEAVVLLACVLLNDDAVDILPTRLESSDDGANESTLDTIGLKNSQYTSSSAFHHRKITLIAIKLFESQQWFTALPSLVLEQLTFARRKTYRR